MPTTFNEVIAMRNAYSIAAVLTLSLVLPFAADAASPPSKMKLCAEQYHQQKIPKNQYRSFMAECMKKDSARVPMAAKAEAPPVTTAAPTQQKQDETL